MRIHNLLLSLALMAPAGGVSAQVDTTRAVGDSAVERLLDHTFQSPSREFVRVRLEAGVTYRASVTGDRVHLEIHPIQSGVKSVRLDQLGKSADHPAVYEIRPHANAEYEIRVLAPGNQAIRLTIDREAARP
ncbi:MAG: hypothetical protein ABI679_00580 [Gemmatimonadota bacterium]